MARQQSEIPANGRQGELQVQRAADMAPRDTDQEDIGARDIALRDTVIRDTAMRDNAIRERSLGELFRDLTTETSELVTKEIALLKAEARQAAATLARDGARLGLAVGVAFTGVLALTAFLIAGLGDLLNGRYWLSALIIGVLFLAIGGGLVKSAIADFKRRSLEMKQAVETLKDTGKWAKQEVQQVKQELTT
jgi:Putative Actinobacterial Holin-X, holin superfamily III